MVNNNSNKKRCLHCTECFYDNQGLIYEEDYFQDLLVRERLRSERSRKPFILMVLNLGEIVEKDRNRKNIKKVIGAMFSSTRGIDIKGWYKREISMGIIFAEINGINTDVMREKIINNLYEVLDADTVKKIEISCHIFPEEYDRNSRHKNGMDSRLYPDVSKNNSMKRSQSLKRSLDIAGSILFLLLFSPLFIIIPLLIKATSRGSVFFKQERLGRHGKPFTFLKFRTMYTGGDNSIHKEFVENLICNGESHRDDENKKHKLYKMENDPRVTPLGRILRKLSLDEIPQFLNVLKGDMSLVGPRPPIPYELKNYDIWHRQRILLVKPGITGIWQVEGRSLVDFNEMVRMDIKYAREWSVLLDIKILLKTPWAVLSFKGAF